MPPPCFLLVPGVDADTTRFRFDLDDALKGQLHRMSQDDNLPLFFGSEPHPQISQLVETKHFMAKTKTPKKPKQSNKGASEADSEADSEKEAEEIDRKYNQTIQSVCHDLFNTALGELKRHGKDVAAQAVVGVVSNVKNRVFSSETQYECLKTRFRVTVSLQADFVDFQGKKDGLLAVKKTNPGSAKNSQDNTVGYGSVHIYLADEVKSKASRVAVYESMELTNGVSEALSGIGLISKTSERKIRIKINEFRFRSSAVATIGGVLSGNDRIEAEVTLKTSDGEIITENINTKGIDSPGDSQADRRQGVRRHFINSVLMLANEYR